MVFSKLAVVNRGPRPGPCCSSEVSLGAITLSQACAWQGKAGRNPSLVFCWARLAFLASRHLWYFFTLSSQVKFWKNNPALQPSVLIELSAPDSLPPRGLVTAHSLVSGCRVCGREGSQERITKIRPSFILQYGFPFSWLFGGAGQEKDKASPLQWQPSLSITWELLGDVALC